MSFLVLILILSLFLYRWDGKTGLTCSLLESKQSAVVYMLNRRKWNGENFSDK